MNKISNQWSSLNLTEKDLPGIRKMDVGSKMRFTIEAEFTSLRKEDSYDGPIGIGDAKKKTKPTFSGSFKVIAIEPQKMPKKAARYTA